MGKWKMARNIWKETTLDAYYCFPNDNFMQGKSAKLTILLYWVDLEAAKTLSRWLFIAVVASSSEWFAEMIFN